jgi:hypothetical protein
MPWRAPRGPWIHSFSGRCIGAVLIAAVAVLVACHQDEPAAGGTAPPVAGEPASRADEAAAAPLTLTPAQIEKLGIVTQAATAIQYAQETEGYGVVVSHDVIAQAAADLFTAQATARQSRAALARTGSLKGTPGAVSADVADTAVQKAEIDAAALTATQQKLSSLLGMKPPWRNGDRDATLQALASGRIQLVRVTFPLGALADGTPASMRVAHLGIGKPGAGWTMTVVWDAPADAGVPGRSFFALLKSGDASEGERLQAWAPIAKSVSGVVIPASAAVLSDGRYWCYVEQQPGSFVRIAIDTTRPSADGYFVTAGVLPGDEIVITAAGLLLAKQSAP